MTKSELAQAVQKAAKAFYKRYTAGQRPSQDDLNLMTSFGVFWHNLSAAAERPWHRIETADDLPTVTRFYFFQGRNNGSVGMNYCNHEPLIRHTLVERYVAWQELPPQYIETALNKPAVLCANCGHVEDAHVHKPDACVGVVGPPNKLAMCSCVTFIEAVAAKGETK